MQLIYFETISRKTGQQKSCGYLETKRRFLPGQGELNNLMIKRFISMIYPDY